MSISLRGIIDEDFVNYKVPSMVLEFPYCSFKCGVDNCQNSEMDKMPIIKIPIEDIYRRYYNNPITRAVVFQGLEPMDSWEDIQEILFHFKIHETCRDDFVIYTGYNKDEISDKVEFIRTMYDNVIIKYGRYIPNQTPHFDEVLGVNLASDNQYAERIVL